MPKKKVVKKAPTKTELGEATIKQLRKAVEDTEKELENKTIKVMSERGVIESDNDWFENWKPEDQDVEKAEQQYVAAFHTHVVAKRNLEKAKTKLQETYRKTGIDPYIVVS